MCNVARVLSEYKEKPGFDIAEVADKMGVAYETLKRMMNEHDRYDLGVTKLIPFFHAYRDLTLLDHIEARLGRVAVQLKPEKGFELNFTGVCRFLKEAGEAMSAISDAVKDGRVSRAEAIRCRRELTELIQVCMGILGELNRIEGS